MLFPPVFATFSPFNPILMLHPINRHVPALQPFFAHFLHFLLPLWNQICRLKPFLLLSAHFLPLLYASFNLCCMLFPWYCYISPLLNQFLPLSPLLYGACYPFWPIFDIFNWFLMLYTHFSAFQPFLPLLYAWFEPMFNVFFPIFRDIESFATNCQFLSLCSCYLRRFSPPPDDFNHFYNPSFLPFIFLLLVATSNPALPRFSLFLSNFWLYTNSLAFCPFLPVLRAPSNSVLPLFPIIATFLPLLIKDAVFHGFTA